MFFSLFSFGQNIKKHQWENRVILIISDNKNTSEFQNQVQVLKDKSSELIDRKLVIYQIIEKSYSFNFDENWILSSKLYSKFNAKKNPFKIILTGLDGGIKLSQTEILSAKKLFAIIDGMPMRKRELIKNKK